MWGALAGAIVGALAAWGFALDLRRRDRRERDAETKRQLAAEATRRWLTLAGSFASLAVVPDWEKPRYLADTVTLISDAYALSPPDQQPVADALMWFEPGDQYEPTTAVNLAGILHQFTRGAVSVDDTASHVRDELLSSRARRTERATEDQAQPPAMA